MDEGEVLRVDAVEAKAPQLRPSRQYALGGDEPIKSTAGPVCEVLDMRGGQECGKKGRKARVAFEEAARERKALEGRRMSEDRREGRDVAVVEFGLHDERADERAKIRIGEKGAVEKVGSAGAAAGDGVAVQEGYCCSMECSAHL